MFRSLRGRLVLLLALLSAAAIAAGILMVALFRQSATAQVGQAAAEIGRSCDAIAAAYRFYNAGGQAPPRALDDAGLHRDLAAILETALRNPRVSKGESGRVTPVP